MTNFNEALVCVWGGKAPDETDNTQEIASPKPLSPNVHLDVNPYHATVFDACSRIEALSISANEPSRRRADSTGQWPRLISLSESFQMGQHVWLVAQITEHHIEGRVPSHHSIQGIENVCSTRNSSIALRDVPSMWAWQMPTMMI